MRRADLTDLDWWAIHTLRSAGHSQREVAGWVGTSQQAMSEWLDPKGVEKKRQYYRINRARVLENQRQYRESNGGKISERKQRYYVFRRKQLRQLRKEQRPNQCLTLEQFRAQLARQDGRCNGCLWKTRPRQLTEDHIVPKSRGGTDDPRNVQLCCHACNSSKGTRPMSALIADLEADGEICPTAPPRWEPEGGWPE